MSRVAWSCPNHPHAAVKVHAVNTNRRIVLNPQIDVFADTEAEVASFGEISLLQFVFFDLKTTLQNFLSLRSAHCNVDSNLLVTTDTESPDSVPSLA